jgi:uncharacterized protein YdaU (DUF1376 family)
MSLAERGLLYALRLECWENQDLPANPSELAKYLGVQTSEVNTAFTEKVNAFFKVEGDKLMCPELDDYRQHLTDRKKKQSEGGKKGAAKTNAKFNEAVNSQPPRHGRRESLVKHSLDKLSKTQSLDNGELAISESDEWVSEYDSASNGQ